jgi:hypothetical protein
MKGECAERPERRSVFGVAVPILKMNDVRAMRGGAR